MLFYRRHPYKHIHCIYIVRAVLIDFYVCVISNVKFTSLAYQLIVSLENKYFCFNFIEIVVFIDL